MALADVVHESQVPDSAVWADSGEVVTGLKSKMEELKQNSLKHLRDQGFSEKTVEFEEYLNMRYRGTESALMVIRPNTAEAKEHYEGDDWAFGRAFVKLHEQELLAGHFGIGVTAKEGRDREEVRRILKSHNGHFINYYGNWAMEKLEP